MANAGFGGGGIMTDNIEKRLRQFDDLGLHDQLRQIACWTARQTGPEVPSWIRIISNVEKSIGDEQLGRKCYLIREDLSGAACAAATIGMRRSPVSANQMLACFGAANETAIDAASESIKHAARWYLAETGRGRRRRLPLPHRRQVGCDLEP